ncbi:Ras family protein [Apiospora arundinis]
MNYCTGLPDSINEPSQHSNKATNETRRGSRRAGSLGNSRAASVRAGPCKQLQQKQQEEASR